MSEQIVKAVTSPTAGDVHVNAPLTNFSQKWLQSQNMFIALRAMPNLPVSKQSDLFYEYNRGDFFRDEAERRADGTESAGGEFRLSTNPYFCHVWAFHKDVSDRQRANSDAAVQLDKSASEFVSLKLMIKREREFVNTFFNTGIWDTDLTPATLWSNASSDPIADVRTGIRTIQGASGFRANRIIFGRRAWDIFVDNDAVLDRVKGGATTSLPALVLRQLVAQTLEIDSIEVMDAVYNSAAKDLSDPTAESNGFIASDNDVLIYYAPQSVGLEEPTAGIQFSWSGLLGNTGDGMRVKRFRMENITSDRVEGEMAFDFRVTAPEMGYFLSNVVA